MVIGGVCSFLFLCERTTAPVSRLCKTVKVELLEPVSRMQKFTKVSVLETTKPVSR